MKRYLDFTWNTDVHLAFPRYVLMNKMPFTSPIYGFPSLELEMRKQL